MLYKFRWQKEWYVMETGELEEFLEEKTHIKCNISEPGTIRWWMGEPIETSFDFALSREVWVYDDLYDVFQGALKKYAEMMTK